MNVYVNTTDCSPSVSLDLKLQYAVVLNFENDNPVECQSCHAYCVTRGLFPGNHKFCLRQSIKIFH
ncbi:hypothetical protein FOXYSP1_07117 [Fusarium oxysporum f. sp. phaseoli]